MNFSCLEFAVVALDEEDVRGKRVLEVGAQNVNGTPPSDARIMGSRGIHRH